MNLRESSHCVVCWRMCWKNICMSLHVLFKHAHSGESTLVCCWTMTVCWFSRIVIMIHTMCHLCDWFTNHEYWLGMSFNCMHMQNMYKHWLNWCIAKSSFNIQILPLNIWHWFQSHSHLCYWSGRLPPLMVTTASETITFKSLAQMNHSGGKKFLERTTHIISLDCNWYYFRSIHTVLQPTFLMIKLILN